MPHQEPLDPAQGRQTLAEILASIVAGSAPAPDGRVEVVPPPSGARAAIVATTGHHVVAADVDPAWVADACPRWAFERPFGAAFVAALQERVEARAGTLDAVLYGPPAAHNEAELRRLGAAGLDLMPLPAADLRAILADAPNPRTEIRGWRTPDGAGTVLLGRGLEGRFEAAIEVVAGARGRGLGRALAMASRGFAGPDGVFAQIAPGNVASLRAALSAGFRPIAAEILYFD